MEDFAHFNLIGESPVFRRVLALIEKFAGCEATVLIQGETGTGKDLVARAVHYLSARRDRPFVPVNCGAIPESLVESELFGHVRGAFTDAREARQGLIAQAKGGTLFLDEIEVMSPKAQVAVLRFLQDKEYRPVGGALVRDANVRVIGSSNADLKSMVRRGEFRSDLLFRLNVLSLRLPPLRERRGDVMVLATSFLDRLNRHSGQPPKILHPDSARVLNGYPWPGNVRELESLLQREFVMTSTQVIQIVAADADGAQSDFPQDESSLADEAFKSAKARVIAQFERAYIVALLLKTAGNISLASRLSGKDRSDSGKLARKYGLDRRHFADGADRS